MSEQPERSDDHRSDGGTDVTRREAAEDRSRSRHESGSPPGTDLGTPADVRDDADPRDRAGPRDLPDPASDSTDGLWNRSDGAFDADRLAYDLDVYADLLDAFHARGYEFVGFDGAIADGRIALRHDVDLSLERAATMAQLEADRGVRATYCLLVTNPLYDLLAPENREHVRAILAAGHDVGLHFDPHYYWDAEPTVAEFEARVLDDRDALERAIDADYDPDATVAATSIHQPPEWVLGVEYDAFESTYEPAYFRDVEYVSDSGCKWRTERPFTDGVPDALQLLVHPGLWGAGDRPLSEILDDYRDRCDGRVERYLGPFGG